jgi:hypothetical protein
MGLSHTGTTTRREGTSIAEPRGMAPESTRKPPGPQEPQPQPPEEDPPKPTPPMDEPPGAKKPPKKDPPPEDPPMQLPPEEEMPKDKQIVRSRPAQDPVVRWRLTRRALRHSAPSIARK